MSNVHAVAVHVSSDNRLKDPAEFDTFFDDVHSVEDLIKIIEAMGSPKYVVEQGGFLRNVSISFEIIWSDHSHSSYTYRGHND